MHSLLQFKALSTNLQINELNQRGIPLDLAYTTQNAEAVLFAYDDFYVELVVEKLADEIIAVRCFRSLKKLEPYLQQVDIREITSILSCS
jgi:hypothetical protein